jgi:hypothetical protein
MNVKEEIQAKIAALEAELAAIPAEAHTLEQSAWERIKSFFHANPAAAAPTVSNPSPTVDNATAPVAPPAA